MNSKQKKTNEVKLFLVVYREEQAAGLGKGGNISETTVYRRLGGTLFLYTRNKYNIHTHKHTNTQTTPSTHTTHGHISTTRTYNHSKHQKPSHVSHYRARSSPFLIEVGSQYKAGNVSMLGIHTAHQRLLGSRNGKRVGYTWEAGNSSERDRDRRHTDHSFHFGFRRAEEQ